MTRNRATVLGFAVAPLAAGLGNAAMALLYYLEPSRLFFYFVTALIFSVLPMVVFAVPMYLLLNHAGLVNLWTSLAAGAIVGALFGVMLRMPSPPRAHDVVHMTFIGTLAALAFWLVWRTGRDKRGGSS